VPAHGDRGEDRLQGPLGHPNRLKLTRQLFAEDEELVAPEARDGVARAQRGPQTGGDLEQELVSGVVAEAVVDRLEAVEVEEQNGDRRGAPPPPGQGDPQAIQQQDTIRKPGQGVLQCLLGQAHL
jgi:hypothetical protein